MQRRQRPAQIALLFDPPAYLTHALGAVPDTITDRRRWLALASEIESIRGRAHFTDPRRALPDGAQDATLQRDIRTLAQRIGSQQTADREAERDREIER